MNAGRRTSQTPRAFTLIELLVVVAIIALLAAILSSALGRARWQTRRVACQANLRQIALAWHTYLDEHQDRFPRGVNLDFTYGGQQGGGSRALGAHPYFPIPRPLNPTLGLEPVNGRFRPDGGREPIASNVKVFQCPADRGSRSKRPTHFWYCGTSYRTNFMLIGQDQVGYDPSDPCAEAVYVPLNQALPSLTRSDIHNTSGLILIGDAGWVPAWQLGAQERVEWHHRPDRHNVAFMDGHAEFLRIRKGIHTCADYTTMPLLALERAACGCQEEGQWP